jgi:uncharacterized membrane protein YgcG
VSVNVRPQHRAGRGICWFTACAVALALLVPAGRAQAQSLDELPDIDLTTSPGLLVESLELSQALPLEHSAGFLLEDQVALRDLQDTLSIDRSPAGLVEGLTFQYTYAPYRSAQVPAGVFPMENLLIAQSRNQRGKVACWAFLCALQILQQGREDPRKIELDGPQRVRIQHVAPSSTGGSNRGSAGGTGGGGRSFGYMGGAAGPFGTYKLRPQ